MAIEIFTIMAFLNGSEIPDTVCDGIGTASVFDDAPPPGLVPPDTREECLNYARRLADKTFLRLRVIYPKGDVRVSVFGKEKVEYTREG